MPKRTIVVIVIVVAFGIFMSSSLFRSCSPHVGFESAKSGQRVQVFGEIVQDDIVFDSAELSLSFSLKNDQGEILPVVYKGVVPSNFEYADQATCAGVYEDDKFQAEQLFLKCPSKYEGELEDDTQIEFYDGKEGE